ncbi:sulfotransferase domain-containing protein [Tabrizicola sp. J26]|uniref:sulfotransferase domain-containing protein n=1 Tax=Alitabrizicola rongguiensis TaxID=2909234 RepID=UPI001F2500F2|nr:sulfotransferase domain-containing protein [Tabrizicola rongguiensis]MCF1707246.1 sulfotransferase domain-containing protein [Tabrizicola rongguiensis]
MPTLPVKTREMHNHHFDSTIWNDFAFRPDDIILATYAKSGTTWMQQIVGQILFDGAEGLNLAAMSPWMDLRVPPKEVKLAEVEAQAHRRFLKTHLPVDALVFSPEAKYIYIGRDGRDMVWSLHNHHSRANEHWYGALNDTPGRVGPPIGKPNPDQREYFLDWLENDGAPFWSYWDNVRTWWAIRDLPNVLVVHFQDLKDDLPGEIARIAAFLGAKPDAETLQRITSHCTFDYMKSHADEVAPLGGALWEGGGDSFIHKGTNGRWRDMLTAEDVAAYEARALAELGPDCARWLASGSLAGRRAAA